MTNGERIRNMTDEEFAALISKFRLLCVHCPNQDFCNNHDFTCSEIWERWLKSEAKND